MYKYHKLLFSTELIFCINPKLGTHSREVIIQRGVYVIKLLATLKLSR